MTNPGHIFISYARKDGSEYANRLDTTLPQLGFTTWRDKRGIDPTQDFTAEIENAIAASACVVTCITPDVRRDNSFVRREIAYAQILNKPIIVARFNDVPPPILVMNHTWIDFFRDWETSFSRLIEVIRSFMDGNVSSSIQPQPSPDPMRDYLQGLYGDIVNYLNATVFSYIEVKGKATPDAVQQATPGSTLMRMGFRARAKASKTETPIQNFADGFDKYQGRVLLLGEPGAGKTTALMAFARDAIAYRLENPDAPLPLLSRCALWDAYKQPSIADWFNALTSLPTASIAPIIEQGKVLLLLDGLDELGKERPVDPEKPDGEKFDPRLRFIQLIPASNQVVVSSRIIDYQEIGEKIALNGAITLQRLTDDEIQVYLGNLPQLWDALQSDETLRDIARIPLLLSLLTFAYEDTPEALKELANLSEGDLRDAIFGRYVSERYRHEEERVHLSGETLPFSLDTLKKILGFVAIINIGGTLRQNVDFFEQDATIIDNVLLPSDFALALNGITGEISLFVQLASNLNLILSEHSQRYRFIHASLRDYLGYQFSVQHLHDVGLHPESSIKTFLNAYYTSPAKALGKLLDTRVLPSLKAMALDQTLPETLRLHGTISLKEFPTELILPTIKQILYDPSEVVRKAAISNLSHIEFDAVPLLLQALQYSSYDDVRRRAVSAISQLRYYQAIPHLVTALNDPSPYVRAYAAEALGELQATSAIGELEHLASDETDVWGKHVNDYVIKALNKLRT